MRTRLPLASWTLVSLAAVLPLCLAAQTAAVTAPAQGIAAVGQVTPIGHWRIQSSAKAQEGGAAISENTFSARGWYPASGHATPMAALLEDGKLSAVEEVPLEHGIFYGNNLRSIMSGNHGSFEIPWWYRTQFQLPAPAAGTHTFIKTNGIIPSADIWLNGHEVATHRQIRGAFPVHILDVTRWAHAGLNTLALRVYPANAERNLVISWIDWNPAPPDRDMGPWRGVDILRTGPVALRFPQVSSRLSLPDLRSATLDVKVQVRNLEDTQEVAVVSGQAAGVSLRRVVHLEPRQTRTITFSPATNPKLKLGNPKVWWPIDMGAHPLYRLDLQASVAGAVSDRAGASFGIRDVTSRLTPQGYRQFLINGKPVLIRGGGWASDMFLRNRPERMADEFRYVRNLGLNTIRLEGKLENQHFYDLADRDGILVMPGWECCDRWEAAAGTGGEPWTDATRKVAADSMASEARLLRNHPSVIAFLIGSDNAPPAATANMYVKILRNEDWPDPIVSAASAQSTRAAGPSGLKMPGPYGWIPPSYWYANKLGGAFGFDSEVGAGGDIPRIEDLTRMLTPLDRMALWKDPDVRQYHGSVFWSPFASLKRYDDALAGTYGAPRSLADYVEKAQLADYANTRAQFEAFNAHMDAANPSTGVIYWMLNNAWPALHWHLFDYYLNPAGAYFGAKKANEPVHIQYSYGSHAIVLVNQTLTPRSGLEARVQVRNLDGAVRYSKVRSGLALPGNHEVHVLTLPEIPNLSSTYFVELDLEDENGRELSRNVYWLSTHPAQLDWAHSNWYTTPVTRYSDLKALRSLPEATVELRAHTQRKDDQDVTTVSISAPSTAKAVSFFDHLSIRNPNGGAAVLPVLWSGNDVTLWPGESATLTARYKLPRGVTPTVTLDGWNTAPKTIPAAFSK